MSAERLIPNDHPGSLVLAEHLARYLMAAQLAPGRTVLDAACGEGYGTAILLRAGATACVGVDVDQATVERARTSHGIDARHGDLNELPFASGEFELVVSFETIEHVARPDRALDELKRVTAENGLLLISTPNANEYIEPNPFHLREFELGEFDEELRRRFANVQMYYQQNLLSSGIFSDRELGEADATNKLEVSFAKVEGIDPDRALYGVAVCSDGPLPQLRSHVVGAAVHEAHYLADLYRQWQKRAAEAERLLETWQERAHEAEHQQREWEARATEAERQLTHTRATLERTVQSVSWKLTRPLRRARRYLR